MTEMLPPHNVEAEESVIGSLLIGGEWVLANNLTVSDFSDEALGTTFEAMRNLDTHGTKIDPVTVHDELMRMGKSEAVGGAARLSHLMSNTPTSLDLPYYADIVKREAGKRAIIEAGERIKAIGYDEKQDLNDSLRRADDLILSLRRKAGGLTLITPEDRKRRQADRYSAAYEDNKRQAVSTGIRDLDRSLSGGFFPGELIIDAGRPGVGKTTFQQQIANHVAEENPVLVCTGEMDEDGLTDRDVASIMGVPIGRVRAGEYDSDMYVKIIGSLEAVSQRKVYIFEGSHRIPFTTTNVFQAAIQVQLRYGLSLVVIDYLGLLKDRHGENQNDRLGYITATLKSMAMELKVPVLCAAQLNRAVEGRADKRPQLHDLRDSGNIEQDADVVLFLYRDSYYGGNSSVSEVLIAKHRQGGGVDAKMVKVFFDSKTQQYCDMKRG